MCHGRKCKSADESEIKGGDNLSQLIAINKSEHPNLEEIYLAV